VNNDEVEFETDAAGTRVPVPIAIPKPIAVGNRALMFHARILDRDQFVTILIKRIFPKPVLERFEGAGYFLKMPECCFFLMRQDPILNIQHATFPVVLFTELYVVRDIDVDSVVVDRVHDFPMEGFLLTAGVMIGFF